MANRGEKVEEVTDLIFLGSKITADGDCSHEIKKRLFLGKEVMTNLDSIGEGNGNPLQCSYLENPRGGGACWAAISGVTQSRTRLKQLSNSMLVSKEQMFFNFMAAVTICSDFGAQENKSLSLFPLFPHLP